MSESGRYAMPRKVDSDCDSDMEQTCIREEKEETRLVGVLKGFQVLTPTSYRVWAVKTRTTLEAAGMSR